MPICVDCKQEYYTAGGGPHIGCPAKKKKKQGQVDETIGTVTDDKDKKTFRTDGVEGTK